MRILIAGKFLTATLQKLGHEIIFTRGGEAGLEALPNGQYVR